MHDSQPKSTDPVHICVKPLAIPQRRFEISPVLHDDGDKIWEIREVQEVVCGSTSTFTSLASSACRCRQ